MKKFIKKIFVFISPFILFILVVLFIDPYNYFNQFDLLNEDERRASYITQPHLYKLIDYQNNPNKNIVLGDSRSVSLQYIMDDTKWSNLAFAGGSINEIIQSFWFVADRQDLDTVLIGINLNLYNRYNKRFWVEDILEKKRNFLAYSFNEYTFKSTISVLRSRLFDEKVKTSFSVQDDYQKEVFWEKKLSGTSKFYEQFAYPDEYYKELRMISNYCAENGIKLIFWIPPNHLDYEEVIKKFDLEDMESRFRNDLQSLGDVFDFNRKTSFTKNKDNFRDPVHFTEENGHIILAEIRNYAPKYSVFYPRDKLLIHN
jgi:hypothetical protein